MTTDFHPGAVVAAAAEPGRVLNVQKIDGVWRAHYDPSCTPEQRAAGDAALAAFDFAKWEASQPQ